MLLVGDYTDEGRDSQYQALFNIINANLRQGTKVLACLGNHEYRASGESGSSNTSFTGTYNRFNSYFGSNYGYGVDNVHVINGYTFIGFSADAGGGRSYSKAKATWLDQQIAAAAAQDPTGKKPIFVFGHVPIWNTALGSVPEETAYNINEIRTVLNKYPQVVYFAGHSHTPCCDSESVWQGGFTAINTGTLAYSDCPYYTGDGTTRGSNFQFDIHGGYQEVMLGRYFEHAEWYASVFTIVEVDQNNRVRLRYYNADADRFVFEPVVIDSIGDPSSFTFTADRKAKSEAPTFSDSLTLLSVSDASVRVLIPTATCPDYVRSYRAEILKNGSVVKTVYRQGEQQIYPIPDVTASFSELTPDTDYTVRVYAYNSFGKMSVPLTLAVHTASNNGGNPAPDVFSFGFDQNGVAWNLLTGEALTREGSPTVLSDGNGGHYATFDGNDAYVWNGIADYYDVLDKSFTFEWIGKIPAALTSTNYVNLASNQENGGIGLEFNQSGKAVLSAYVMPNGSNNRACYEATATVQTGKTVHLVGTYDGSALRLYINGALSATKSVSGKIWFPLKESARYLAIGADSSLYGQSERFMSGEIRAMNIYSSVLSASAIQAKYQASGVGN